MEKEQTVTEFNITEWDGTVDRVKVRSVWNERTQTYDLIMEYPDGVAHQISSKDFGKLKPKEIHY